MLQLKMELTVKDVKELIVEAINTRSSLTISEKDITILDSHYADERIIVEIVKEI